MPGAGGRAITRAVARLADGAPALTRTIARLADRVLDCSSDQPMPGDDARGVTDARARLADGATLPSRHVRRCAIDVIQCGMARPCFARRARARYHARAMKSGLPVDVSSLLRTETIRVEYKKTWNHVCGGSALRTICAFANDLMNVNGGYVLLGVEQDESGRPILPVTGLPADQLEDIQKGVRNASRRIQPSYTPLIVVEQIDHAEIVVIWCPAGDGRPYDAPESLAEKKAARKHYVRTHNGTEEARGGLLRQLHEVSARVPFDDRACPDARLEDLSPALIQHHLRKSGSRLAGAPIDIPAIARRLHLSRGTNGHEVPRNVALLFFSEDPTRWFPGARIEVVQHPHGRAAGEIIEQTFEGPIPAQLEAALSHLQGFAPDKVRKRPGQAEAERIHAWPFEAVEEALVNAVHHRGYDRPDPIKVELLPDKMRITSYPGPVPGVQKEHLTQADAPLVPARNRRIADLLKEIDLAEARGTGWPTIIQAMQRNGSPAPRFDWDEERTYFEVVLPTHPAFLPQDTRPRAQTLRLDQPAPPAEVVGRDTLVERLWRTLDTQSVLLVAPPGRGTSSLLGLLASRAPESWAVYKVDMAGATMSGLVAALVEWGNELMDPTNEDWGEDWSAAVAAWDADQSEPANTALRMLRVLCKDRPMLLIVDHLEQMNTSWQLVFLIALLDAIVREERLRLVAVGSSTRVMTADMLRQLRVQPVPFLTEDDTAELAARLLRGCGIESTEALVQAVVTQSAGSPDLVVRLVQQLHVESWSRPEHVAEAMDELLIMPGDPTGLRHRCESVHLAVDSDNGGLDNDGITVAEEETRIAILDVVAERPCGRERTDILAATVTEARSRLQVLGALRALELEGWLTSPDGPLRFEHPHVREAWLAWQAPHGPPADDSIPS